jgi:hypothetical protein
MRRWRGMTVRLLGRVGWTRAVGIRVRTRWRAAAGRRRRRWVLAVQLAVRRVRRTGLRLRSRSFLWARMRSWATWEMRTSQRRARDRSGRVGAGGGTWVPPPPCHDQHFCATPTRTRRPRHGSVPPSGLGRPNFLRRHRRRPRESHGICRAGRSAQFLVAESRSRRK